MAKILIVDDSPTHAANARKILEGAGHQVVLAEDGTKGIDVAKSENPQVILMDVVMPELNGFQATRKLSQDPVTKDIPVILLTTKDQDTDKVWGERQGAKGYLVKPAEEKTLLAEIGKFL